MNTLQLHEDALPHIVFFEPNEAFWPWLLNVAHGGRIVDVGAGCGLLSRELNKRGYKVLAIDIIPRENPLHPVALLDATTIEFPKGVLPIMARPCHNEWIDESVHNAMRTNDTFIYIGLEKNFAEDLSELALHYSLEYVDLIVGNDGEKPVIIRKK